MLQVEVTNYYASEIDADAIRITKFHHMDTITHLGRISNIDEKIVSNSYSLTIFTLLYFLSIV